jgi:hypothetical protein
MRKKVKGILGFHATKSFPKGDLVQQGERVADLYRALDSTESDELARHAIDSFDPTEDCDTEEILRCLASFQPGSLNAHHDALIDHGILYPGLLYHGASEDVATRILGLLPGENANHLLTALAWIGGNVVQQAFAAWRDAPPDWIDELDLPPHRYSLEAGWELSADGSRRDLFVTNCHPLVPPGGTEPTLAGAQVVEDHEGTCGWCGRNLTTLLHLDLTSPELAYLGPLHGHLRITTCEVCSCYGPVFTKVEKDGSSRWHASNRRPDYLPEPTDEWVKLPRGCLVPEAKYCNWRESADWLVPGVRFSQLGGHPTWIQRAEYPECPGCRRAMPFVAQLSNEDYEEFAEGIYYLFACGPCGVAATCYEQS